MLVDSNILVYSLNISSPKCQTARAFLQSVNGKFCVAQQNILETMRIITHNKFPAPMKPNQAMEAVLGITNAGYTIWPNYETIELTLQLVKKYDLSGTRIFDAYLTATMINNEVDSIVTDNEQDFKIFQNIKVVNPFRK